MCAYQKNYASISDWHSNNKILSQKTEKSQFSAEKLLIKCDVIREKTKELAVLNKEDTNHALEERINDLEFHKNEAEEQRKEVLLEIEVLSVYKQRTSDALKSIDNNGLRLCKECISFRENRVGIDLVHDNVERELLKEAETIKGAKALLAKTLEQVNEQLRKLRSLLYFIDHDLEDKTNAVNIDNHNKQLTETNLKLGIFQGKSLFNLAKITPLEWKSVTSKNFSTLSKELNNSNHLRSYIDLMLTQIAADLKNQYNAVNEAFRLRIDETKQIKTKLEDQNYQTIRLINKMLKNITNLEKAIADKQGFIAIAHMRLGNRTLRPGIELCKDTVQSKLILELKELIDSVEHLQQTLEEAQAELRTLYKTQNSIEEDINIKANSLKIDEVDCMTTRQRSTV